MLMYFFVHSASVLRVFTLYPSLFPYNYIKSLEKFRKELKNGSKRY